MKKYKKECRLFTGIYIIKDRKAVAHGDSLKSFVFSDFFSIYLALARQTLVVLPETNEIINKTKKTKNKILAIPAAPAAIPPKPNTAAIIATIKKITDQRNIILNFSFKNWFM
jgi:hypothetical protein